MVCNKNDLTFDPPGESMQMYLVTIARLRAGEQPLPLSRLAEALAISPVSVNEMCRKLQDLDLVVYLPYKGVLLTSQGEQHAFYILRRHRLWEVFLVDMLGLNYAQAHEAACQLEHSTSNIVADRLDTFLGYPAVNPQGELIPQANGSLPAVLSIPLADLPIDQCAQVVRCQVDESLRAFLAEQGVRPGVTLRILAAAGRNMMLDVAGAHISLARSLAESILVKLCEK